MPVGGEGINGWNLRNGKKPRGNDPVATNPTPALENIARERGWRILKLFA